MLHLEFFRRQFDLGSIARSEFERDQIEATSPPADGPSVFYDLAHHVLGSKAKLNRHSDSNFMLASHKITLLRDEFTKDQHE